MNEIDKMRNSQLADMEKPEIQASFIYAKKLVAQLRMMSTYDDGFREVLEELVPSYESREHAAAGCLFFLFCLIFSPSPGFCGRVSGIC